MLMQGMQRYRKLCEIMRNFKGRRKSLRERIREILKLFNKRVEKMRKLLKS